MFRLADKSALEAVDFSPRILLAGLAILGIVAGDKIPWSKVSGSVNAEAFAAFAGASPMAAGNSGTRGTGN